MEDIISVIIPVYNSETTLKKCIESVIFQTYRNLEILIIESASTDNSAYICDYFAQMDSRIRVIHQTEKKGLSNARNEGLKLAKGEYICFLDSDDWITKDMYEILYNVMHETSSDIVSGNVVRAYSDDIEDATGKPYTIVKYSRLDYAKKFFKITSNETVHYVWNKMYKRDIAMKMQFPEGLIAEDVEGFFYALANSESIVHIKRDVYYYRYSQESMSSDWFSAKQMDIIAVWKHILDYCNDNNIVEWLYYAKLNYYRSFFAVLTRMLLSRKSDYFPNEKLLLITEMRRHYWELIRCNMPFNRKLLMTLMCTNYALTEWIYWLLRDIKILKNPRI